MKISLDWLKDYIKLPENIDRLAQRLTISSVAVDEVVDFSSLLDHIVVGEVLKLQQHPNADRLQVVFVDAGKKYRVVCGGKNLFVGAKVALALPGAQVLWHGQGKPVKLTETEIRGEKSFGMICAAEEIGFMREKEGDIMILSSHAKNGQSLADALQLKHGVFALDVLPNRGDLLSHEGVAREIAALEEIKFGQERYELPKNHVGKLSMKVVVKNKSHVLRYSALVISGILVGESPDWMKNRLMAVGLRPINNVVDLTNYLMFDLGQPFHAFDYDAIVGNTMIVRDAQSGEVLTTLDGKKHELEKGNVVIEDSQKLIDLAGIMGGESSQITSSTKNIVLQAAVFDARTIRSASRALGHRTEAVVRYEKGVDQTKTLECLAKAWALLREMMPDIALEQVIDFEHKSPKRTSIPLHAESIEKLTGMKVVEGESRLILERLGCVIKEEAGVLHVSPPSWRPDLSIEQDLIEEVVRLYGFEHLGEQLPLVRLAPHSYDAASFLMRNVQNTLVSLGFHEVINSSLLDPRMSEKFGQSEFPHVRVLNPLSVELSILRSEVLSSLLMNSALNARNRENFRLFEIAHVFEQDHEAVLEHVRLSGVLFGAEESFFAAKGAVQRLFSELGISAVRFEKPEKEDTMYLHAVAKKGQLFSLMVSKKLIGSVGTFSNELLSAFDIEKPIFWFDIDLSALTDLVDSVVHYRALPKFPSMYLDLSIIVDVEHTWEEIEKNVYQSGGQNLKRVELFDVYTGAQVMDGKKSLAFHLEFTSDERTLTGEEVMPIFENIQKNLVDSFGAEVRSA